MSLQNTFVVQIDLSLADKLKNDLANQGFVFSYPPHSLFSAKKKGISCTLYTSGKLTVQGKDKHDFITFYLEPQILGSFPYSHPELQVDMHPHIGIDEAGKGDFFGPLCIAGVYADSDGISKLLKMGIRDSKQFSDQNIRKYASLIIEQFPHSLVRIFPETYNRLYQKFKNLNALLAWAHATTMENLYKKTHCLKVTIDQFAHKSVVERAVKSKSLPLDLFQRHKGEEDPVVAAASILARNSFLEGLEKLSQQYGTALPKGASNLVIEAGKNLVLKLGPEILQKVAKTHFKTINQILNLN